MDSTKQTDQQLSPPPNNFFMFPPPPVYLPGINPTNQLSETVRLEVSTMNQNSLVNLPPVPVNENLSQPPPSPLCQKVQYDQGQNYSVRPLPSGQSHSIFFQPPPRPPAFAVHPPPPLPPRDCSVSPSFSPIQLSHFHPPHLNPYPSNSSLDQHLSSFPVFSGIRPPPNWQNCDINENPRYVPQEYNKHNDDHSFKKSWSIRPKDPDEVWIKNWTNNVVLEKNTQKTDKIVQQFKISQFKDELRKFAKDLKELESLTNCLSVLKKSLTEKEWIERCKEIEEKKGNIQKIYSDFILKVEFVEKLVKQRKKKRIRQKKKKVELQKMMREAKTYREREHKRIDMWLEKMKEEVERAKREEQVKAEADIVLYEVTQKKSEAKYTLTLLSTLTKLRNARMQSLSARGGKISQNENETFTQIIEKLKKYWIDQLKEYNFEEQGLRVMLDHAEVERSDIQLSIKKQILQQWSRVIFGKELEKVSKFELHSLEELISVRIAWDKYICVDNSVMASNIPIGWVVPTGPSNQDWTALLES